jgi:hypothetical protein
MTKIFDLDGSYEEYRILMLIEAEEILGDKKRFISQDPTPMEIKSIKIQDLLNFFYVEEEHEIYNELYSIYRAIYIKNILHI